MIRRALLGISKDIHQTKKHHSYKSAKRFGVLFNGNEYKSDFVNKLANDLIKDGKDINLLGYFPGSKEANKYKFTKKGISFFGKITQPCIEAFIKSKPDLLIVLADDIDIKFEFVIKKTNADYNIWMGNNNEPVPYFHLSLDMSNSKDKLKELIKYLKMIKND